MGSSPSSYSVTYEIYTRSGNIFVHLIFAVVLAGLFEYRILGFECDILSIAYCEFGIGHKQKNGREKGFVWDPTSSNVASLHVCMVLTFG